MSDRLELELKRLQQLFTIVFCIDHDLKISRPSPVALGHMPFLDNGMELHECFDLVRPRRAQTAKDLMAQQQSLYLMKAKDGSFAVRGQMISLDPEGDMLLVFCGSPWLSWLHSEHPGLELGIGDFSAQDSQLDQLFYMTTEKTTLDDLELLTKDLQGAKAELERSQKAREDFFAQMSHEMRTPLNGVVSAASLLEQHQLPEDSRELVNLIQSASGNLMQVINYVLDVAKIQAPHEPSTPEPIVIKTLIESVFEVVEARARVKDLSLKSRLQADLGSTYLGDAPRLRQTLLNLITNAINFTDRGEVMVEVGPITEGSPGIRFDVVDTGVGIPEDLQDRIFEPFFTATDARVGRREPGTGLGLDIVRQNVEWMGGELKLTSSLGQGTTFSISLPLSPFEAPESPLNPDVKQTENPLRGSILLVDDNETNLTLGTMLLERLGLRVQGAASGEEAVEAVKKQCFCAVLMDISMPGIDGIEATRRIRKLPGRQNLPIIALTAYASSREQERAREVGMNDYLTKPVQRNDLAQTLRLWLPSSTPARQTPEPNLSQDSINFAVLDELLAEIGKDNFTRVVETFRSEARSRCRTLTLATSADQIAREAHSLKSTCRSFGLDHVAASLEAIEDQARQGIKEDMESRKLVERSLEEGLVGLNDWQRCLKGNLARE